MNGGGYIKKWFPKLYDYALFCGFTFKPSCIIQPWQFGHGETKATCLWLNNLPILQAENKVEGREGKVWKMTPGPQRSKLRSKTYPGIAAAMANQWSNHQSVKQLPALKVKQ